MRRPLVLSVVLAFGGAACAHGRPATPDRFLYQLSCDARLERFDTGAQQRTDTYDLTKLADASVPAVTGPLEICLTNQAVFDAHASVFYTVVPGEAHPRADGTMTYRVLGFSIPSVALVSQVAAGPAGAAVDHPPRLTPDSASGVRVVGADGAPRLSEDLARFAVDGPPPPNRIVETSGHLALLDLIGEPAGPAFAVADAATHTLVRLRGPLSTTADNVHLTPGGTHVLVEETSIIGSKVSKTGRVWLYDGQSGLVVRSFVAPHIQKLPFRGVSPGGKVLYELLDDYWFLDLGLTFTATPVERPLQAEFPPPAIFFSDR